MMLPLALFIGARWPDRAAGGLRQERRVKRRPLPSPRHDATGARQEPAQGADDAVGKEQDGAHEEPAEEEKPKVRVAGREPALDPVDAEGPDDGAVERRSEEHTSELQSPCNLVCR